MVNNSDLIEEVIHLDVSRIRAWTVGIVNLWPTVGIVFFLSWASYRYMQGAVSILSQHIGYSLTVLLWGFLLAIICFIWLIICIVMCRSDLTIWLLANSSIEIHSKNLIFRKKGRIIKEWPREGLEIRASERSLVISELNAKTAFLVAPRWLFQARQYSIAKFKLRYRNHNG